MQEATKILEQEWEWLKQPFSCLRRLKTYLRSTMGQERLNHILVLNVHQAETDLIEMKCVARDFISLNEMRRNVFGHVPDAVE